MNGFHYQFWLVAMDVVSTPPCCQMDSSRRKRRQFALHGVPGSLKGECCLDWQIRHGLRTGFSATDNHERQITEGLCLIDLGQAFRKVQSFWMLFRRDS